MKSASCTAPTTAPTTAATPAPSLPLAGQLRGKLKSVPTVPGQSYNWMDNLTKERSHSFAFRLDQTRKVAIDLVNTRSPGLLGLTRCRDIEVILWSESGQPTPLFSVAPGSRDYETLTLKSGRYLLELKTRTSQKIDYALRLTALKWLMLGCFVA